MTAHAQALVSWYKALRTQLKEEQVQRIFEGAKQHFERLRPELKEKILKDYEDAEKALFAGPLPVLPVKRWP